MPDLEIRARVVEAALVVHGRSLWVEAGRLRDPKTICGLPLSGNRIEWEVYHRFGHGITCPDCLVIVRLEEEMAETSG